MHCAATGHSRNGTWHCLGFHLRSKHRVFHCLFSWELAFTSLLAQSFRPRFCQSRLAFTFPCEFTFARGSRNGVLGEIWPVQSPQPVYLSESFYVDLYGFWVKCRQVQTISDLTLERATYAIPSANTLSERSIIAQSSDRP